MATQGIGDNRVETVDIKEYIAILLKRKWLILICFLLSMAGTTAFLFTRQPVYRATAKLLATKSGGAIPGSEVTREDDRSFYDTQVNIMYSSTMQQRVLTRMKKTIDEIRDSFRNFSVGRAGGADIIQISVDSPSREFAREYANTVADEYLKFRDEQRAQSSESALLMMTREINRLSQELKAGNERLTAYMREHNLAGAEQLQTTRFQQALNAFTAAAGQLTDIQTRKQLLESKPDAASALAVLAADSSTAASGDTTARLETAPRMDELMGVGASGTQTASGALGTARPTGAGASSLLRESDPLLGGPAQPTLRVTTLNRGAMWGINESRARALFELENNRRALEKRLEDLRKTYREKHPAVMEVENALEQIKDRTAAEVQMVQEKTAADLKLAQSRYAQVKEAFDALNQETLQGNSQWMEYRSMREDVARVQNLYDTLLGQLMKIDMSQNFKERAVLILEPAIVQRDPVYPKKAKGLLVAAFFGLGLGLALAFFIEYIDDSIKLAEEVERELQLPFLGMIPAAQWNPEDLTAHRLDKLKQQGGVAEAYRVVRSAILFATPREKLHTLMLTSAVPREGKTTTCINLSIGFSQVEDRVLLVDADLRRGEIHKYFNFNKDKGLADVLLGEATPEEVVKQTDVPKLDIITAGAYPANPAELLLGWRLKEFLSWARQNYSRVIIDCTPVMGIADSAILGSAVDGVVFVIWAGRTSRRYVRVAKMTAVSRGAKIFGFVLNNLEPGRVGYYHYYPYYYSYYSRGYYYYYSRKEEPEKAKVGATPTGASPAVEAPAQSDEEENIDDVY